MLFFYSQKQSININNNHKSICVWDSFKTKKEELH